MSLTSCLGKERILKFEINVFKYLSPGRAYLENSKQSAKLRKAALKLIEFLHNELFEVFIKLIMNERK